MRDGRFFHVAWFCSVCILPAGRRMWRGLPARALLGRSGGQRADGSSGALAAIEKAGMAGASADFRSAGRLYGRFVLSHALGRLRGWPWEGPPCRGILSAWTTDAIRQGQEKCAAVPASKLRNGQAARQQTGRSICRSWGGQRCPRRWQGNRKGEGPGGLSPCFFVYGCAYWAGTASGGMGAPCSGPAGRVCTAGASCTGAAGCAFSAGAGVPSAGAGAAAS